MAFLDSLQSTLRTSGFNEQGVGEVMQAMQVLAKYNIMGLGLGLGVAAMAQMRTSNVAVEPRYESHHHDETPPDRNDYIRPSNEVIYYQKAIVFINLFAFLVTRRCIDRRDESRQTKSKLCCIRN